MNKSWENIYFLEELRYEISGKGLYTDSYFTSYNTIK